MKKIITLFVLTCFLLGSLFIGNIDSVIVDASVNWQTADYYVHRVSEEALFGHEDSDWGAGINPVVVNQLLDILRDPDLVAGLASGTGGQARNAGHFSDFVTLPTIVTQPNGAIYIRLFDELPDTVTTEVSGDQTTYLRAFTNSIRGTGIAHQGGGARWWQLVYLQDGILTLWMVDPYRGSLFNEMGPVNGVQSHVYWDAQRPSIIRENMVADFNAILGYFNHSDIANAVIPTNNVSWQQERHNTHARMENESQNDRMSNPGVPQNDLIWLPSWYEIFNTSYDDRFHAHAYIDGLGENSRSGQWNMNAFDRGYSIVTNFSSTSWLRSAHLGSDNRTGAVSNSGNRTMPNSYDSARAVRPAIHIDVRALIDALPAPTGLVVTRPQNDQLTLTWNAVNNATSYRVRFGNNAWQTVNAPATTVTQTISAVGPVHFDVYAVGDGINFVNSGIASISLTINKQQLTAPSNLQINAGALAWTSTNSLGEYVVYRDGTAISGVTPLTTTSWTIPATWTAGTWNLQVRAIAPSGDTWHTSSELSTGINHIIIQQTRHVTLTIDGVTSTHTIDYGEQLNLAPLAPTTPSGYEFRGWATTQGGQVIHQPNATITVTSDTTLYAVITPLQTQTSGNDTPWAIIIAALCGLVLVGALIAVAVVVSRRKKRV